MNAFRISMHYMLNSVDEYEEIYSVDTDEYAIDELAFDDLVKLRDKLTTFINDLQVSRDLLPTTVPAPPIETDGVTE